MRLLLDIKDASQVQQIVEVTEQYDMIDSGDRGAPLGGSPLQEFKALNPDLPRPRGNPRGRSTHSRARGCSPSMRHRRRRRAGRRRARRSAERELLRRRRPRS